MNDEIKRAILQGADANRIKELAVKNGLSTLQEYGKYKVIEGVSREEAKPVSPLRARLTSFADAASPHPENV